MNGPLDPCHAGTEALEVCNTAIKNQCIISKICLKEGVTQQGFFCWVQKYCSVLKSPFFNKRKWCWWNDRHSFKWKKEKGGANKYTTRMYCMKSSFNGGEVNIDLQPKQNHSVLLAGRKSGDSPVRMLTPNLSPPVTVGSLYQAVLLSFHQVRRRAALLRLATEQTDNIESKQTLYGLPLTPRHFSFLS